MYNGPPPQPQGGLGQNIQQNIQQGGQAPSWINGPNGGAKGW